MDKKPQVQESFSNVPESIVGPSVKIDGDLKSSGNLKIDGVVTGKVSTSKSLFVGESANINADVAAENAIINGAVQGNIKVAGNLVLGETGKLVGDITCGGLEVRAGAIFNGKCQMKGTGNMFEPVAEKADKK